MYASHFAILILAASAAAPALCAPLGIHSGTADVIARDVSTRAVRDPEPFGSHIRDLLKDYELRSEGVSTPLYERDDIPDPSKHTRDDDPVHTFPAREYYSELLDSLKRDDIVDDIQARSFLSGFVQGLKDDAEAVGQAAEATANEFPI
ncbi:hypothetical protein EI94DRAFT_1786693 [Lactarius quietus]|nr:hypothetical protein EI94DRAFT_1786693 [Lactarius quietus]